MAKTFAVIGVVLLLIGVLAAVLPDEDEVPSPGTSGDDGDLAVQGGGGSTDDSDADPSEDNDQEADSEPEPEPVGFGNGVWRVGEDIDPGTYRTEGSSGCYWARLDGFSGDMDDIKANDFGSDPMIVEILDVDEGFESNRCARWVPLDHHLNETADDRPYQKFQGGTYVVGDEIEPGLWWAEGGNSCYWERLSGLTGGFENIEANDNADGQAIVEIRESDVAFSSNDCGDWVSLDVHLEMVQDELPYDPVGEGTFQVGTEMEAGEWRSGGGSSCYWARLSGFSGDLDDIEANGLPDGTVIVEIQDSDAGFTSSGCGEWEYLG